MDNVVRKQPVRDNTTLEHQEILNVLEVILNESDCSFATRICKVLKGFPTRLVCGRICTEIRLHMTKRELGSRLSMAFAIRYIDDFNDFFRDKG